MEISSLTPPCSPFHQPHSKPSMECENGAMRSSVSVKACPAVVNFFFLLCPPSFLPILTQAANQRLRSHVSARELSEPRSPHTRGSVLMTKHFHISFYLTAL